MPDPSAQRAVVLAEEAVKELACRGMCIVFAESCTAGLASGLLTRVPGSSKVFWGSFVTYTAEAKNKMLGVPEELINRYGAVSREVALAMAEGALEKSGASLAFSVTGLAGPGGDNGEVPMQASLGDPYLRVPIGTVWIGAVCRNEEAPHLFKPAGKMFHFSGSRDEVREAAVLAVLEEVLAMIKRV
jgi:PncC family amidohydrolase